METWELLEQARCMLLDVKEAIDEGTWQNSDREWYADLTELIRALKAKIGA